MIDLSQTRAGFLAELEATELADKAPGDITDSHVANRDAHVGVHGNRRADLFLLLKNALSERFADVPRPQLIRDLLIPLRNALGNAYKHGNGRDRARKIRVEMVFAR
jgi:hypothetical protein